MQWTASPKYEDANHAPIVRLNHDEDLQVKASEEITLDASPSIDPDGDELEFTWWVYPEAGTYEGQVTIQNANRPTSRITIPVDAAAGETIHVICEVKDKAEYPITRYRRVVLRVE